MTMPAALPEELFATLPPAVQLYIRQLEAFATQLSEQVVALTARVVELEAKLGQDSSNSSRPPSSDGPQLKRGVPRPPSQRRRGAQPGHTKHKRVILPPDQIIDHKPPTCRHCSTPLAGDDPDPLIDQVIELPEVMRHVTHHRRHTLACPHCQARTTADPVPEAPSGFGPRLQAATAYFGGVGRLGKRAIGLLFSDLDVIPIALGSVSKLEARTSDALGPIHAEALGHTRGLDANVDETGWKQGSEKAWLWVAVTTWVTVFLIRRHRNRAALDDLVGPTPGVLTTDRFAVYAHLPGEKRQICWSHLRRDFQAMIDRRDRGSPIGEDLLCTPRSSPITGRRCVMGPGPESGSGRRSCPGCARRYDTSWMADRGAAAPRPPGSVARSWPSRQVSGHSRQGRAWSRRTMPPNVRCVTRCAGGRRATEPTASGVVGSLNEC